MSKTIRWIILGAVALLVGAAAFHFFYYGKEETIAMFERVKDFVNQPLPIVGVSTLVIGAFALKAVSMTAFGSNQVNRLKAEHESYKETSERRNAELSAKCEEYESRLKEYLEATESRMDESDKAIEKIVESIKALPNRKAKEIISALEEKEDGCQD